MLSHGIVFVVPLLALAVLLPSRVLAVFADSFTIAPSGTSPLITDDDVVYNAFGDVYVYNLRTKRATPLFLKPGQQYATGVWKEFVVYEDVDDTTQDSDVRLFNRKDGKDLLIAGDAGVSETSGVTNGKEVVYVRGGACGTLHAFSLKKNRATLIAPFTCHPIRIWKENVIFPKSDPSGSNIQGYNLKTKTLFDVATENDFQETPNIYNDTVVWLHRTTGAHGDPHKIVTKNLHTGEIKTIYESTDALNWPAISKHYVVWSQSSAPNIGGLMGVDLRTGEVFEVQPQHPVQNSTLSPAIWDNTTVWSNGGVFGAMFRKSKG